jgi:Icc-related predicted phosphoesterase
MIIDCVSDLHGHYPQLKGGDLLIIAGDLTARDSAEEWFDYFLWQGDLPYRKIIFIAGNHDNRIQNVDMAFYSPLGKVEYLCDTGTEFEGLKIWGSPWTTTFKGINPNCKAFTVDTEEELTAKFSSIPDDIDILVTHSPPYTIFDQVPYRSDYVTGCEHVGSMHLFNWLHNIGRPKLHVFGHIHEGYGQLLFKHEGKNTWCVNASHVNRRYKPVNKPIRIIL